MKRYILLGLLSTVILLTIGKGFLLHSDEMFQFHDITQAARVSEFSINLANGVFPPRIAPHFDHMRGYPVFNHYAPLAFYIASILDLAGMSIPYALKTSFAFAVLCAGCAMYHFLRSHMNSEGAFAGAFLYATSSYLGTEIFVRGNSAEVWFIAVLPLVFWRIDSFVKSQSIYNGALLACSAAVMLLAHNVLSIVGFVCVIIYALSYRSTRSVYSLLVAIPLAGFFLFPAILELSLTQASALAKQTSYQEHFICLKQVWNSPIGYAGSVAGCTDGMSFQVGKILILSGLAGLVYWVTLCIKKRSFNDIKFVVLAVIGGVGLLLTLPISAGIWEQLSFMHVFQFPWRFLVLPLFIGAFFGGYGIAQIRENKLRTVVAGIIILLSLYTAIPFFSSQQDSRMTSKDYSDKYLSEQYIQNEVVYQIPEYVPTSVDYTSWLVRTQSRNQDRIVSLDEGEVIVLDNGPFEFSGTTTSKDFMLDMHMAPFWEIKIDGKQHNPYRIDELGRPYYTTEALKTLIEVRVVQTPLQKLSNVISIVTGVLLVGLCLKKWKPQH